MLMEPLVFRQGGGVAGTELAQGCVNEAAAGGCPFFD